MRSQQPISYDTIPILPDRPSLPHRSQGAKASLIELSLSFTELRIGFQANFLSINKSTKKESADQNMSPNSGVTKSILFFFYLII